MLTITGKDGIILDSESCRNKSLSEEEKTLLKSTGVVRKVDELGRVVIPIELRRTLGIAEKDALEIYVDKEKIILKKYEPACIFCGNAEEVQHFHGKNVCHECATAMTQEAV
jgi:transcriptional pleiotropic regulator of transition state genes